MEYPSTVEIKITIEDGEDYKTTKVVFIRPKKIKSLIDSDPFLKDLVKLSQVKD